MKKKHLFYFIFIIFLIIGCNQSIEVEEIEAELPVKKSLEAEWLLGKWKYEDENGILYENWTQKNDTIFMGESYFIEKNDTVFFEYMRLTRIGDSLFYESLGENKINPKSKIFRGIYSSEGRLEVENMQQAFPKKVKYNQLNDTLMIIEVSGIIDGSEEIQPYEMIRINSSTK